MSFLPSPIPHPLAWWHDAPGWILEGLNWVVGVQWPAGNEKLTWDLADAWYGAGKDLTPAIDAFTQGGPEASLGFGGLASDIGTQIDAIWRAYANDPETGLRYLQTVLHEIGQLVDGTACDIESAKVEMYVEIGFMIVELIMLAAAAFATFGTAAAAEPAAMAAGRFAISRIFKQLLRKVVERAAKKAAKEAIEAAAKKVSKEGLKRLLKDAGKHALREGAEEVATEFAVESSQLARGHRDGGFDLLALGFSAVGGGVGGALGGLAGLGPNVKNKAGHFFETLGRGAAGEMIAETGAGLATGQGLPSLANLGMAGTSGVRSGLTDHVTEGLNDRTHDKLLDIGAHLDATNATVAAPSDALAALAQPTRDPDVTGLTGTAVSTGTTYTGTTGTAATATGYPSDGVHSGPPGQTVSSGLAGTVSHGQSGYATTVSGHTGGASTDLAGLAGGTTPSTATVGGSGVDAAPASTHTAPPGPGGGSTVTVAPTGVAQPAAPTGLGPATLPTGPASTGPASTGLAPTATPAGPAQIPTSSLGTSVAPAPTGSAPPVAPARPTGSPAVPVGPHGTAVAPVPVPVGLPTGGQPPGTTPHRTPSPGQAEATASRLDAARRREALAQQHRERNLRERDQQYQAAQRRLDDSLQRWMDARQRHDPAADRIADQEVIPARQARAEAAARLVQAIFDPAAAGVHTLDDHEFASINTDEGQRVRGGVDTGATSARPGDQSPPVEDSRGYGEPGGHRMPLEYDQTMVERYFPRDEHGRPVRFPDPDEVWFELTNDGGPEADPTRGINCTDCVLSLFDSWMHGRPRVAAPRTFDAYADGDPTRPLHGQPGGIARIEDALGTTFTPTFDGATPGSPSLEQSVAALRQTVQTAGHGAFAAVMVSTTDGRTHVFAAVNYHGDVRYLDPQRAYRSTTFPVDTAGVTSMSVAVVDADVRPVPVPPATPAAAGRPARIDAVPTVDPTGPGPGGTSPPGSAIPGSDFRPDGRPAGTADVSPDEVRRAVIELRAQLGKLWVRVSGDTHMAFIAARETEPFLTARVEVGPVAPGLVTQVQVDPATGEHVITIAPRTAPDVVVRAIVDAGTTLANPRAKIQRADAGLLSQLDVLATERARLNFQLGTTTGPERVAIEERLGRVESEFALVARRVQILPAAGLTDDPATESRRAEANATLGDAARAWLTDLALPDVALGGSSKARSFLPLSDEFRAPYDALDSITYYMQFHASPAVREAFEAELMPHVLAYRQQVVADFKTTYKSFFGSTSDERPLSPERTQQAVAAVTPLVESVRGELASVQVWCEQHGIADFEGAVELGEQAWQAEYTRLKATADAIIARYTYRGAPLGYIGSMQDGRRGPHKAMARCDLRVFDLDLYVVNPDEFDRLYDAVKEYDSTVPPDKEKLSRGKIFVIPSITVELAALTVALDAELEDAFPGNTDVAESEIVLRREPPY